MNNTYYETRDKNFKEALKLVEGNFLHEDLISMLKSGNIPQKQFAAMELNSIKSKEELEILLQNLTGQDGKIREAVSWRIKELIQQQDISKIFNCLNADKLAEKFLSAITDINGNICRNIIETLPYLSNNEDFNKRFIDKLVKLIFNLLNLVKDFDIQDGKYKINKEIFKLYWCLEALNIYWNKIDTATLKSIINISKGIEEYTIREKTAKILSNAIDDDELLQARQDLKRDKNYYVRRY